MMACYKQHNGLNTIILFLEHMQATLAILPRTSLPIATEIHDNYDTQLQRPQEESQNPDIVLPSYDLLPEIHDEDFQCQHLAIGFVTLNNSQIPIAQDDALLECLLFPDLYPYGYGSILEEL
jgi:hypothetical protein